MTSRAPDRILPDGARRSGRSRTPPTRGFWDHYRARKKREHLARIQKLEAERQKVERERELAERDAMWCADPLVLDRWARDRETAAMQHLDDWNLLHWFVRFMD